MEGPKGSWEGWDLISLSPRIVVVMEEVVKVYNDQRNLLNEHRWPNEGECYKCYAPLDGLEDHEGFTLRFNKSSMQTLILYQFNSGIKGISI
jgi:hypothetical protein